MDFDIWLSGRLQDLKTDEAVFGPYIRSILEGDESLELKQEDLDGLLMELGGPEIVVPLRDEIMSRWKEHEQLLKENSNTDKACAGAGGDMKTDKDTATASSSLDSQFEKLLQLSPDALGAAKGKDAKDSSSVTDSALRAAILNQYQEDASGDEFEDGGGGKKSGGLDGVSKNTNASSVLNAQKEMKEKAKAEAAKKREKDREDRARQKKLAEEKKEKAKAKSAKVERKR